MDVFDIAIVGGGPGGCAAALELGKTGLRVLLVDRDHFPRDKVCGDAIPGPAVKALARIDERYAASLEDLPITAISRRTRLYLNGHRPFTLHWETRAYTCRRTDFDHHLIELVSQHTDTTLLLGRKVRAVSREADSLGIQLDGGEQCKASMVIGADGAHSVVGRQLAGHRLDHRHYGGAVRQYYRGVSGMEADRLEIHSLPDFMPGYFWIFPLADGGCNVGFGMHSMAIKTKEVNLRRSVVDFIQASPELRERFRAAEASSPVQGFGLPFGSRRVGVAGDRYLLVGDAAALVDPLTGDGIGQAIISGRLAARHAGRCVKEHRFGEDDTADYKKDLRRKVGRDLRIRSAVLDAHRRFPFLVDWGATLLNVPVIRRAVRPYL